MKKSLIILALVLLAGFIVLAARRNAPITSSDLDTSRGPAFVVQVVKPLSARPLFGLIPESLVGHSPDELRIDQSSPGAKIGSIGSNRVELSADGWHLLIETDAEGNVAPTTHIVFPMELAGKDLSLRCRPANPAIGFLRTTARAGSDKLDGDFLVEFPRCENAETGKNIKKWPPAPLTVRGSFAGVPR